MGTGFLQQTGRSERVGDAVGTGNCKSRYSGRRKPDQLMNLSINV